MLIFSFFSSSGLTLSEETSEVIDQDNLDHLEEKYPEVPELSPIPKIKIRGFGDCTFSATYQAQVYDTNFNLGNMGLLFSSDLNDRLSFLTELSAYRDIYYLNRTNLGFGNSSYFKSQGFVLKYAVSDDFNIAIGRLHTAMGYWNHTFHHGPWLQPSILRPEIYRFKYIGGILPTHSIGAEIFGFKELRYHIGVSNGREKKPWVVQNFNDANKSKALTLFLTAQPHEVERLRFGGTFYLDTIPPDPANSGQLNKVNEQIAGGHLITSRIGSSF